LQWCHTDEIHMLGVTHVTTLSWSMNTGLLS
jgi:hypothetical protein